MNDYCNRDNLKKYIHGEGIEIGALQNPLDLSGLKIKKLYYVDKLPIGKLRKHYPELNNIPLIKPDIIDDAQTLRKITKNSLDFIIANHLIEHLDNPILALVNWTDKLKMNGIIFLTVPDKRFTFDKNRNLSSLEHITKDYEASEEERHKDNLEHYEEWVKCIQGKSGEAAKKEVKRLMDIDYSIHFHVWTSKSFKGVISSVIRKCKLPLKIIVNSKTIVNEFTFILKRVNT